MRNMLISLFIGVILLFAWESSGIVSPATSIPTCTITNLSAPVGKSTLSYSQVGNGRPILLLHGLFANKEQWDTLMCQLSDAGYRALAPDLPGYGNSNSFPLTDYALENQAQLLHDFVNGLGIQSLDLAGNSMGGAIAYLYAQKYPEGVRSLAFIGAPMGIVDWGEGVKEAILQGINPFIPISKEEFELEMSLLFVNVPKIPDSYVSEKVNDYITNNRHYQQVWNIVNLYDDIILNGETTPFPTLIMWGEGDGIYESSGASKLQQIMARSELILLPKTGHLPQMENVDEVGSNYLQFLRSGKG